MQLRFPWVGCVTMEYVRGSLSGSLAGSVIGALPPSATLSVPFDATGAWFTAETVTLIVAVFEFAAPSLARNVNESGPL